MDEVARTLADASGAVVISVEYRLAPSIPIQPVSMTVRWPYAGRSPTPTGSACPLEWFPQREAIGASSGASITQVVPRTRRTGEPSEA